MANTILTPDKITREALRILHEKLNFIGNIHKGYDDSFAKSGAKIGDSLRVRLPNQYTVRSGATLDTQDTVESSVTLQVNNQKGVDVNFSSSELTLDLDDFSERILEPAMAVLASNIEADALTMTKDVYNLVGTPGTTPATLKTFLQARAMLNRFLAPKDNNRNVLINSEASVEIIDALKALFNDNKEISKQYREGMMGRTAGFNWYENELIHNHTNGAQAGTPLVDGASQSGATIDTDGWTGETTIKAGTVLTFAGVNAVHPETKADSGVRQQFVVTADVAAESDGSLALPISPAIVTSGAKQNVTAGPADNAAITISGNANAVLPQNLAFHKEAFTFATADLIMPSGVDFASRQVFDGISMRIVRAYDINTDKFPCRIDVLYGYKTLRPQLACRITG